MKKLSQFLLSFILVVFLANAGWGQILTEDFTYSGLLTDNGWTVHSGTTNFLSGGATGLTYSGYAGSGVGNAVSMTTSGADENIGFASKTSGSVYFSFMVNVTSTQTAGDYFIHLTQGVATLNQFFAKVYLKKDAATTNFAFGILKKATTAPVYTAFSYTPGTVYLLVMKYTFNTVSTTDDVISLFVNPTLGSSEPVATLTQTDATQTDATSLDYLALRQGSATNAAALIFDGIRVTTAWSDIPLPITLSSFNSNVIGRNVILNWKTSSETNNSGFDIERADTKVQSSGYSKVGFVEGKGTKSTSTDYTFADKNLQTGKYKYRLKQIDYNGNFEYFELNGEVEVGVPKKYDISQNYPNPFNPVTKINFDLPENGLVNIRLYDMLGREVAVLVNEVRNAGYHTVQFDASKLSSGIYFYKMNAGKFSGIKKMAVVK